MQFSANLGFLWTDRPLADAIRAAKDAGFTAVECHWPYDQPVADVRAALQETGLEMLGLNTTRGNPGENGLSALPDRQGEADAAVAQALDYAREIGCKAVHVMAGFAEGPEAHSAFVGCLSRSAKRAARDGVTILIEPLNRHDAPGYFLKTTDQAVAILKEVSADNLKLMFDCYHVGRTEGDVTTRLQALLRHVGHVQFASVPARCAPDQGELDYTYVFEQIAALGWVRPLGAEYKPQGATEDSLGWMTTLRPSGAR